MFGTRVRQLRREEKLSQEELGNLVGVHTNTISKWENGAVSNMGKVIKLAQVLKTTSAYLLGDSDDPERKLSRPAEKKESPEPGGENIDAPAFIERLVKDHSMIVIENGGKFMLVPATPEGFAFAAQVNRGG